MCKEYQTDVGLGGDHPELRRHGAGDHPDPDHNFTKNGTYLLQ